MTIHALLYRYYRKGWKVIDTSTIEDEVHRVQAGEVEAFIPIVQKYQQQLYIYSYRMLGKEQDAEDAVQDIFMKAYKSISRYRPTVSFNAWLYKIAYHSKVDICYRFRHSERRIQSLCIIKMCT